jgi:hypothetical protein
MLTSLEQIETLSYSVITALADHITQQIGTLSYGQGLQRSQHTPVAWYVSMPCAKTFV